MNLTQMKNTVLAVLAAAGSAVAQALGGWDVALKVLICFMALDYVIGWLVAAVWHKSAKSKKSRRITYSFKKVNATGYQYQWSTHRNFKSNFLTKNTKSTKVTIKTTQSRRRYYVRVRAYKTEQGGKKIYGKWSNVKSVRVK